MKGFLLLKNSEIPVYLKKYKNIHLRFENWCKANKISKLEACLNYVKKNKHIDKIIIGIDSVDNLKEIVKFFKKKSYKFPKGILSQDDNLLDIRRWKK